VEIIPIGIVERPQHNFDSTVTRCIFWVYGAKTASSRNVWLSRTVVRKQNVRPQGSWFACWAAVCNRQETWAVKKLSWCLIPDSDERNVNPFCTDLYSVSLTYVDGMMK